MRDAAGKDLLKIEKLLEKIEKDIKKHQDKEIYKESEKFMKHVQKTIELYSLTLDEVIGTSGLSSLPRHGTVLRRMFRGMQGQVRSVLKFALYYFKQRSEKLIEEQQLNEDNMLSLDGQQAGSYAGLDNKGSPSPSQSRNDNFARSGRPNFNLTIPNSPWQNQSPSSGPQSLYTLRNTMYSSRSPVNNSGYSKGDFVLQNNNFNGNMDERGHWGSLNQLANGEEDDIDNELQEYMLQHQKMKEEIDDFLRGKEIVSTIAPSKISSNLKQILRGLEYTTKKVDQLNVAPVDDDDELDAPNFTTFGKKINKAFNQAKIKAVQTLGGVKRNPDDASPRGNQDTVTSFTEKQQEIVEAKPDPIIEARREAEREEELNKLKEKLALIEQEKSQNHERLRNLSDENATLVRDKRELREKVLTYENEIVALKEKFYANKLEWEDSMSALKRRLEELQRELTQKRKLSTLVVDTPVRFSEQVRETETLKAKNEEKLVSEEEGEVKEAENSVKSPLYSSDLVGDEDVCEEENAQIPAVNSAAGKIEGLSDLKSDSSGLVLSGQGNDKSLGSSKKDSTADNVDNLDGPVDTNVQMPTYQSIVVPTKNNEEATEGPKDQASSIHLYQNGPSNSQFKPKDGKDVASPKANIQVRNIKKTNTFIKPGQPAKGKKELEQKGKQNNSVERIPEKGDQGRVTNHKQPSPAANYQEPTSATRHQAQLKKQFENLAIANRTKTEGEPFEDSMEREIYGEINQILSGPKTERVGTANVNNVRVNIDLAKERQGLRSEGQQHRTLTALSPRAQKNKEQNGILGPMFSARPDFNRAAMTKGHRDEISPGFIQSARPGYQNFDGYGKHLVQSVLDIKDDYGNQEYSPKADIRQILATHLRDKQVVGVNRFGQAINSSKKVIKRKSMEGLDNFRGGNSYRDEVVQKRRQQYSPINAFTYDSSDRLVSEPSSRTYLANSKLKAYEIYADSPRNTHNPRSAYYLDTESPDFKLPKHIPMQKTYKVKLTIDECIRQAVLKDTKEPATTKEQAQMRVMYRAMLTRAKQQPKVSAWMKKTIQESNQELVSEEHPVVDYESFEQYVTNLIQAHVPCGENCNHMKEFYAKIGYVTSWNNREVMSVKRTQIGSPALDMFAQSPKFPTIKK